MDQSIITLIILGASVILFVSEVIPLAITALLVPVALSLTGVLPATQAFSYFGNKWVVIFMAMFMVGEAVFRTGLANKIGRGVVRIAGKNQTGIIILIMVVVGIMSAFLSNTGTTVVFIPIVMGICASAGIKSGKILMPMAFAASLGGVMTLVGTPPNGIANSLLEERGLEPFGFFEFAKIGGIFFIAGLLFFIFIGKRFLPDSEAGEDHAAAEQVEYRTKKMWIAIVIFIFVVVMMATNLIPLVVAAVIGACLVVITGCITMKEAFHSVSWTTIFLFAGMLPMSEAMQTTGAAKMVADVLLQNVSSPILILAATYLLTALLTNFMSNTATTALMVPIGLVIAKQAGLSPYPVVMSIAMAASACFLTPVATPPNTIVLGPGGYRFTDYIKTGWMLQVLCAIIGILVIPLIWPM